MSNVFDRIFTKENPISKQDIIELSRRSAVVAMALKAHDYGYMTWEQALMSLVYELAKSDKHKTEMLYKTFNMNPSPILVVLENQKRAEEFSSHLLPNSIRG